MIPKGAVLYGMVLASSVACSLAGKNKCRVAVCFSGAIRSLVHPAVHNSIRKNLIEAIEADGCEVDIFAYATRKDTVGGVKKVTCVFTLGINIMYEGIKVDVMARLFTPTCADC